MGDLSAQDADEDGNILFSQKGELLSLAKNGLLIRVLWTTDLNQKKILAGVQKQLEKLGHEECSSKFYSLVQALNTLFENLLQASILPLQWHTPENLRPFFKATSMRVETPEAPFERLVDLVRLSREFSNTQFLVLVGVRGYLSPAECDFLCRDLSAAGVPALFLDPFCRYRLPQEKQLFVCAPET